MGIIDISSNWHKSFKVKIKHNVLLNNVTFKQKVILLSPAEILQYIQEEGLESADECYNRPDNSA